MPEGASLIIGAGEDGAIQDRYRVLRDTVADLIGRAALGHGPLVAIRSHASVGTDLRPLHALQMARPSTRREGRTEERRQCQTMCVTYGRRTASASLEIDANFST